MDGADRLDPDGHPEPDEVGNPGWVFAGWGGACDDTDDACTIKMNANKTLSANWVQADDVFDLAVTVTGSGRVEGGGVTCHGPGSCTEQESANSTVVLKATPDDGFMFTGWSGTSCSGTSDECNLTMNSDRCVTATFAPLPKLTVTVNGNGNVSGGAGAINCGNGGVICSANFAFNATVTLIATPGDGRDLHRLDRRLRRIGDDLHRADEPVEERHRDLRRRHRAEVPASCSRSRSPGQGTVTGTGINCGNGSTICSTTPAVNATVTLTATPAAGATFSGWGGSCSGAVPTCTVQMTGARSVIASFTTGGGGGTTSVLLSVVVTGSGTVSGGGINCGNGAAGCSANLPVNSAVTLTATPAPGASFNGWTGGCTGNTPTCTVTMNVARSVNANFTAVAAGTLVITVKGKGTVSTSAGRCIGTAETKTCVQKFAKGARVTLTRGAAAGNTFAGWGDACVASAKKLTCILRLDTGKTVSATFLPATSGGGGGGGGGGVTRATLTSSGRPIVAHTTSGYRVILRFNSSRGGVARLVGLRAGRVGARVTFRIAAGPARVGPVHRQAAGLLHVPGAPRHRAPPVAGVPRPLRRGCAGAAVRPDPQAADRHPVR